MYLAYSWIMTAKSAAACHFDFCSTLHARSPRSGSRARSPRGVQLCTATGARRFHVRADEEPSFFPDMSYPEKMSAPHLAPDANSIGMAVSPAGAAAVDPDKTNAKRTLFKNMSPRRGAKESDNDKNCTPTTGEKRATRESHIVALCGYDPNATPEQICRTLIGKIDARSRCSQFVRALFDL